MAKYKIGITEAGDAGLDLSWKEKLGTVDGAVVITKCVSPAFYNAVLANKDRLIVHATSLAMVIPYLNPMFRTPTTSSMPSWHWWKAAFPKRRLSSE